ncbi:MAG TPA: hypothetical protein VH518_11370 [Tepidisphaeraceae bacterium]
MGKENRSRLEPRILLEDHEKSYHAEHRISEKDIQVDSSKTGTEEDEMVARLLKVEHTDEPTEIVIHVNMLKEGWDVTNLYTIVPLRAANARTLIEQSIGRGLRLPYGKRTGVTAVDRLNIVAHDRFQEIVEEASNPNSTIRLQQVVLSPDQLQQKTVTIVSQPQLAAKLDVIGLGRGSIDEQRLEDYLVSGLIDFDDVAYDDHADLLYDLAEQVVSHLRSYLSSDDARKVLRLHQREIARFVHAQMQKHFWQDTDVDYDVVVTRGFTALRDSAYTSLAGEQPLDFRISPSDKSNMPKYLFGGFKRCLYPVQKFQSDAERKLAVILEREALKWFKPAKGQFQIYYKWGADHPEYQPDFVAETNDRIFMLEPKASNQMTDAEVLAKRDVAVTWCKNASAHAKSYGGKPWRYLLLPHDAIADNMTLAGLAERFSEV